MRAKPKLVPKMNPGMTKEVMKKHMAGSKEKAVGYKQGGKVSKKGC